MIINEDIMGNQLQHITNPPGTPCKRCGIAYSAKTCYVACLEDDDTFETWFTRQHDEVKPLVHPLSITIK